MIRVLQLNMNRSKTANDLLYQLASERRAHILLLSEQYQDRRTSQWFSDRSRTAAIWIIDPERVPLVDTGTGDGFVWVRSRGITFFSCYLTPNQPIADYRRMVDSLEDQIRNTPGLVVVGGDFNARAIEWGMPATNSRGSYLLEMAAGTDLHVLNVGDVPTFRRPGYGGTIPDVSFASEGIINRISGWRVLEDYSASDHQAISFEIIPAATSPVVRRAPMRWNVNRINSETLHSHIVGVVLDSPSGAEDLSARTMEVIETACEVSMPRLTRRPGRKSAYWWTPEIASMRKRCLGLRRAAQRARNRPDAAVKSAAHKEAKRELRRAISRSKIRCWRELCEDVDNDPWGTGYKIVTQKLGGRIPPVVMDPNAMADVVEALFPVHPVRAAREFDDPGDINLFRLEELTCAVQSLRNKRAPGPDGVPAEILKLVAEANPGLLLSMYNACLSEGIFCSFWKVARLVLIPKGKGDPGALTPSSFRPLCMLDTAGKVLEKMLRARIAQAIVAAGDLSPRQHGFRSGHSTIDAIQEVAEAVRRAEDHNHWSRRVVLLVTLDVKNAFNSARWNDMLWALEHSFRVPTYLLRMVDSYLKDRALLYDTLEGQRRVAITSGAAQGSILGPDLWNVSYDSLLRLDMPDETLLVGYADDVAALISARSVDLAQLKLDMVMRRVNAWMRDHGLSLALSKTEIVILTKKRIQTLVPMWVGNLEVDTRPAARYLGVMIDCKMNFGEQIRRTAAKAAKGVASLGRLMANVGGPRSSKRRLLMSSVNSVLLYGAEVWGHALSKRCYRNQLLRVQRKGALRIASAYRTVSEPAVLVIAGVIPIHLLVRERLAIYRRRFEADRATVASEERERSLAEWQASWEAESRGRWTSRLIPDVRRWIDRKHGEVGYYVTQFLSGHGYYRAFLHKIGKAQSPHCPYCSGVPDTAEHTFFACGRWHDQRSTLVTEVGPFNPDTAVETMLRADDSWNLVTRFAEEILKAKKSDLDRLH